jgi:hypothetical protein
MYFYINQNIMKKLHTNCTVCWDFAIIVLPTGSISSTPLTPTLPAIIFKLLEKSYFLPLLDSLVPLSVKHHPIDQGCLPFKPITGVPNALVLYLL